MRLLIVGSINSQITDASKIAVKNGADVSNVDDINKALEHIRLGRGADLIMVDVSFDVAKLITSLKSEHISVPVVGFGLQSDSIAAVKAIKAGAKEYIPLPPDEEMIAAVIESIACEKVDFIAGSAPMQRIVKLCDQVAKSDASVLITGGSGTGKEVIAKYIHKNSGRAGKRMVSVNCAAIPDNLLESELFGHEKGAFTGAVARRIGKFEEADGATLLLDEISEMDLKLQAKLLRAIQEREIDRVGGNKPVQIDIRIIATSNRNLLDEVKAGNFREDLYFRLNVINIPLPDLKERGADIEVFAKYFINKFSESNAISSKALSKPALEKLMHYSWPGNVREMENIMHRAVLVASADVIDENDIMLMNQDSGSGDSSTGSDMVGKTIGEMERKLIINTLDHCLGNRTQAADILGISIRTLRNKLNEYKEENAV